MTLGSALRTTGKFGCPKHRGPHPHLNIDMDLFPQLGVRGGGRHEVYGDICSKHQGPFPHLNIDMDTLPQLGVRGGGHHEMYGAICPKHRRSYPHLSVDMDLLQRSLGGFLYILAPFRKASISMSFAAFRHPEASQKLPKSTLGAYKRVETTKRRLQGGVGEGWERFLASFWCLLGSAKSYKITQSVLQHLPFSPSPNAS